jgi:limonene 1,2-monooxygenase
MRFGAFLPPFHRLGQDPTGNFRHDLELIDRLDELGLDEAWVGEHHSGGWSTIASPELMLAAAAERTRRIMLGTGVVSLPYHHPFTAADRMVQLDHQTRGRIMFGMGSGVAPSDAYMMGIAASEQRRMMAESLDAIHHLLTSTEPLTRKTDWFELREARLQLRPYTRPCPEMMVAGTGTERSMRLAGKYGINPLTFAGLSGKEPPPLGRLWEAAEEEAAKNGTTVDRGKWRVAICTHVAETRQEAYQQVRRGAAEWFRSYVKGTIGAEGDLPAGREVESMVATHTAIIGSPADAIEAIEYLAERSGGVGSLLLTVQNWATRRQTMDSFELFASEVVPHFTGSAQALRDSQAWEESHRDDFSAQAREASRAAASGRT